MIDTPAKRVKDYIEEKGIKLTYVASKTGIPYKTLHAKINGKSKLGADEIELICTALERSPNDFIKIKKPMKSGGI